MIALLIISIVTFVLIYIIIKWPTFGWITAYKVLIDAFYYLFIVLICGYGKVIGATDNLNVDLHRLESLRSGVYVVVILSVCFYCISQIPFICSRDILRRSRLKIIIIESILYFGIMTFLIVDHIRWTYSQCPEEFRPANELVRMIHDYNDTHSDRCSNLSMLGLKNIDDSTFIYKGQIFSLKPKGNEFTLLFKPKKYAIIDPEMLYSSDSDEWDYVWD